MLVIFAELINTAIEAVVDIIVDEYHPRAKAAKDVAAGAVLVTAINAVIVAYVIFFDKFEPTASSIMNRLSSMPTHIVFVGIVITLISILIIKAYFKTGTPLQGGMPSGHSALAFALSTAIWIMTKDIKIFLMALFLSFLVVQSRVEAKIHSVLEVIIGGFVGILIMLLIFQLVHNYNLIPFLK
jgi:diacylglycerol kinase (ATP)